ncbi:MAG: substrate-binding domain-containing protein [Hyphomicrobiaceae bacterium]|nr:substrate-binding domain-containing protein [Hyphomicrobiaceae bacterium]
MKRALLLLLIVGLIAVPVFNAAAAPYKVGFACMTLAYTWMTYAHQAVIDEAAKYDEIELTVVNAQGDAGRQYDIMENFIAQGYDAILVNPLNVDVLVPVIEAAAAAGIPVATFDRRAFNQDSTIFHVGADDVFGGRLALEYVASKLDGVGKIVHILGELGASPTINRALGIHEQIAKYPELEIVFEQSGKFNPADGLRVMEDAITSTAGDFDAVICANDDSALGAIQAMIDAGIDFDDVIVVGYDGVPGGLNALIAGELDATIQYPVEMARLAMEQLAVYLIDGTLPEILDLDINPWMLVLSNYEATAEMNYDL